MMSIFFVTYEKCKFSSNTQTFLSTLHGWIPVVIPKRTNNRPKQIDRWNDYNNNESDIDCDEFYDIDITPLYIEHDE
jgi:hypothetical protein